MADDFEVLEPFLIAPTLPCNANLDIIHGSLYSVDMVRLDFYADDFATVSDALDRWAGLFYLDTYTSNRIGNYRQMWAWDKADAEFDGCKEKDGTNGVRLVAGFGLVGKSSKIENRGFVEFNPNKVPVKGRLLLKYLDELGCKVELSRYDLAVDFPISRDSVRMCKDKRKYGCEISNGMTEYLGQRNNPGRVKVYDKSAESELDSDCTRVELTCKGDWSLDDVLSRMPTVFTFGGREFANLRGTTKAFVLAVCECCQYGDVVEPWLRLVAPNTKSKLRRAMQDDKTALVYNVDCIKNAMRNALKISEV